MSASVVVCALLVVLSLMSGLAVGQDIEGTFTDDFEDGDAEGWVNPNTGATAPTSSDSIEGDWSLLSETEDFTEFPSSHVWQTGPVVDTTEDFDIRGTTRVRWDSVPAPNSFSIRLGITGDQDEPGENAYLIFDRGANETFLGTYQDDSSTQGNVITDAFENDWVQFRIQSDAGSGTLRAKVWANGTAEPSTWQLERSGFDGQSGTFGMNPGRDNSVTRDIWLDSIQITGTRATDPRLSLETSSLLKHGETNPYEVTFERTNPQTGRNETIDVTDEANVTSLNTSAVQVNEANETLSAVAETSFNDRVTIRAEYNGSTTFTEVAVAEVAVENLDVLPPVYRIAAFLGDWTIILLIISIGAGIIGTRVATSFMGLSMMELVLITGWFGGYISRGLMLVSVFAALFIGLNLAANIDYQVQR